MLDLSDLYQLVTFADCGTLSSAAEKLHISQPTLTRTMHTVEDAFGVPLFHRGKNRIALTATGKIAVQQARLLLSQAERAIQTVQTFEHKQHTITIHSCAPVPLWTLLPTISHTFPDNIISSKLANTDEIIQNVLSGHADIGILPQSYFHKNLRCIPYLKEQLSVCIPKEHKLANESSLSLSQINGFNCLLRDKIGFWTDLVKQKMPASRFLIQTNEFEFEELVRTSTLFCFSSNKATDVDPVWKGRKRIPLTDPEVNVTYHLISLAQSTILQSIFSHLGIHHQK